MTIELQGPKKAGDRIRRAERAGESHTRNFPLIGFRNQEDRKAEDAEKAVDGESSEPAKADDPEDAKEIA